MKFEYEKAPAAIYEQSFGIVEAEAKAGLDRLPQDAAAAARVTRAVLDVLGAHGYDRVQPPTIEFEKSMASRMAGVQPRRMFRFVDPASLRTLALRSDITVQVGRIAATALGAATRPLRLCYAGQVVTIKGDGLDPTRERLQLGDPRGVWRPYGAAGRAGVVPDAGCGSDGPGWDRLCGCIRHAKAR